MDLSWPSVGTWVLCVLGLLLLVACLKPGWFVRAPMWLLCHSVYRIRPMGQANVPAAGPALLVCNHVTYLDWLFLLMAQRRHIHFVIFAGWTRVWGLGRLLKWGGVIPIDKAAGPRAIVQALRQAGEVLKQGGVVCIFAEGRFTRTGFLLPFHRGFEQIVKHCPEAPIVPVYLDRAWGSIFSFWRGTLIWKRPERIPYPVTVAFGPALKGPAPAAEVRAAVQKLAADCALERRPQLRPLHRRFARSASRWRNLRKPCLVDPRSSSKQTHTYGHVLYRAICLARLLRPKLGDAKMVGIWAPPGTSVTLANLSLALLGRTTINLDYTSSPQALRSVVRQAGLGFVLTTGRFLAQSPWEVPDTSCIDVDELLNAATFWQKVRTWLSILLLPTFVLDRWVLRLGRHNADDIATVIFVDKANAEPRGVPLSHGNIAATVESLIQVIDAGPRDRVLALTPLFESFGYITQLWAPLYIGASIICPDDEGRGKEIGEACKKHRITLLLATYPLLSSCLEECRKEDFETLRLLWCGGEKLPASIAGAFTEKFGIAPLEGYGRAELTGVATLNVPDQDLAGFRQIGHKTGTIGQPMPGVAARILDPQTGNPLPPGKEGRLAFYGPNVMQGYLGDAAATSESVRAGWFDTGELARMDEEGFITLSGPIDKPLSPREGE